jgi:hypothetical protein
MDPSTPRGEPLKNRRSTFVVPGFQAQLVATELAWLVVCFVLFVAVLLGPLAWEINSGAVSEYDLTWATEFLQLHSRIWMPLCALFLGVTWMLVRLSHRVAGPLYRFRQVFAQVTAGDLSVRVRVRDNDYLVKEGDELDGMIVAMRDRVRRAQVAASALHQDLSALSGAVERGSANQIAALVARAAETENILAEFVTEPGAGDSGPVAVGALVPEDAAPSEVQTLLVLFISVYGLASMAAPGYTSALDRASVMRVIGESAASDRSNLERSTGAHSPRRP